MLAQGQQCCRPVVTLIPMRLGVTCLVVVSNTKVWYNSVKIRNEVFQMVVDKQLENKLFDNGIYEAWQFVTNTAKTLSTTEYCKDTILRLLSSMQQDYDEWKEALWNDLMTQESKVKKITVTTDTLPKYLTPVVGKDIPTQFLLNKLTKDFFQYARNVFDSISQIANVSLLGNKAKKPDSVDFPAMLKVFNQQTYKQNFPDMCVWYNTINADPAFQYIDAFNNRTKHTCDVYLKVSMDFLGDNHTSDINPFFRKDVQHDKKDISGYLNNIFNFVSQSFDSFMVELAKEYPKKIYLHNRYNKLKGWQTKMNNASDCNYAVAYIETSDDISTMPEEISVLLLSRCEDGTIYCKNCSLDTILVKKAGTKYEYIGRYIAEDPCGDDTLLRYRKYHKDTATGEIAFFKTIMEWKEKPIFYKANPFIKFTTVSDDNELLTRMQLPF